MTGKIDLSYGTGQNLFVVKVEPAFELSMLRGISARVRSSLLICPQDQKSLKNSDIGKEVEFEIIHDKLGRDKVSYAKITNGI